LNPTPKEASHNGIPSNPELYKRCETSGDTPLADISRKGVGCIYQQTVIDTYTKVACAKLYDRKNALVAADMLNDRVIPFFEEHDIPLLRILTDRGTEHCGNRESITSTSSTWPWRISTSARSRLEARKQTAPASDSTRRFCRSSTRLLPKKVRQTLEELQADLDLWIKKYNERQPHIGKYYFGRNLMQTFMGSTPLANGKMLGRTSQAVAQTGKSLPDQVVTTTVPMPHTRRTRRDGGRPFLDLSGTTG